MKRIEGVGIGLTVNGEKDVPAADGYVGQLTEADNVVLAVASLSQQVHAFDVDGQKNVVARRNFASDIGMNPEQYRVFQQRINVKYGERTGVWYTEYPQNHLRLIVLGERGAFTTWEIGLISQGGRFFVTVQDVYSESCYRDTNGKVVCPAFDKKWPQFTALLGDLFLHATELPPVSQYRPKNGNGTPPARDTAKVLWWNQAQGLGMVAVDKSVSPNGTARVHWSNLAPRTQNGFAYLETGETVRYEATRSPHQTRARATAFQCELVGVKLA